MEDNKIIRNLVKDIKKLENTIKYRKLNNVKNFVAKSLIKTGIGLNYALPYIFSAIIAFYSVSDDNIPFRIDEISEKAKIETINTSSSYSAKYISEDHKNKGEILKHTTGWIINENGFYERIVTSYKLNDDIDLSDTDKVFAMSKEEIDNALVTTNVNKIVKSYLDEEDMIYEEDAIIIINNYTSNDEFIVRDETLVENIINSLYYILLCNGWATILKFIERKTIKTKVKDKLNSYQSNLRIIKKEELYVLKNILELKRNNLDLINGKYDNEKNNIKTLRKNK